MRRRRHETLASRMMSEVAIYGGLPMRRVDIFRLASEHLGDRARDRFGADYFAFRGPAVELEPWTLEEARRAMEDAQ